MPGFSSAPLSIAPASMAKAKPAEQAERLTGETATLTLSGRLWGLDLTKGLPRVLTHDGVEATVGELSRVRGFIVDEFPFFGEEWLGAKPSPIMVDAKLWYLNTASDLIELRHHGKTV